MNAEALRRVREDAARKLAEYVLQHGNVQASARARAAVILASDEDLAAALLKRKADADRIPERRPPV